MNNFNKILPLLLLLPVMAIAVEPEPSGSDNAVASQENDQQASDEQFAKEDQANGEASNSLTLDSMAVTATVEEAKVAGIDIKTLPLASTIINQEEINRLKFVDPDELLDRIPGETQVRNLRIPNGAKSYTIPLIDGVALGSPLSGATQDFGTDVSAQDIQRIEIIKGPVSALFHNNAFGGVINVITKGSVSLPEQNTRLWAEAGSYDRYRGGVTTQGDFNGVGYILDFSSWNISAYRDQGQLALGRENPPAGRVFEVGEERQQASGKLIFHPDEVSSLLLHMSYLNAHEATPGELFESDFRANDEGIGRNGFYTDEENFLASGRYQRDFTDVDQLTANFVYRYADVKGVGRFSGLEEDIDMDMNGKVTWKHDFDFLNSNFIIGTDIYHGTNDDFNPGDGSKDYGETDIYSGFAQIQFSPIEDVEITAGFRHESIDIEFSTTGEKDRTISFSETLPKAGISWDYLEDHRVWFSYGEGFLVPTVGQLYTSRFANDELDPEEAEHYEVGLRGRLPIYENDLTYDVSYYYQDIDSYIVTGDVGNGDQNMNAGKVNVQGVEGVFEYQPFDFLRLGVTYTFQHNTFDEYIDANGVDLSGEELSRSNEHHINGRVAVLPMEGLAIELEVDSASSYSTIDNAGLDPKGRFDRDEKINLRLTYDNGPYELWFHALNIADVKEDRVSYNSRGRQRSIRTVDGLQLYGGIAYNF